MNFEQHEAPVVRKAMRGDFGAFKSDPAEGFDGIGVELGMGQQQPGGAFSRGEALTRVIFI